MGLKGLAIRILDFLAGSRQAPARQPDTDLHLHWDRFVRAWSERRPGIE
jgi:hypothetical protein